MCDYCAFRTMQLFSHEKLIRSVILQWFPFNNTNYNCKIVSLPLLTTKHRLLQRFMYSNKYEYILVSVVIAEQNIVVLGMTSFRL